ncbi:MAG: nuclear transport factor 2 family protein [Bacteroidales bacterium]|nr:nuclear transport factor 2 family protein [Bacteroidales bacterium]
MKKNVISVFLAFLFPVLMFAQDNQNEEKEAIKIVIQTAYVDGLQNNGDLTKTEQGFHPGFNLLGVNHNGLTKFPIYSWIEYAKNKQKENPEPPAENEKVSCEFVMIDITDKAAVAKIELLKDSKKIFTDYLSLYKFNEGWRIVSKIYANHR